MKKQKMFITTLILVISMIASSVISLADTNFSEENIEFKDDVVNYVIEKVKSAYEKDYTISEISGFVNEISKEDDGIHLSVNISLKRILLEKSADELKYVQGLEEAASSLKDDLKREEAKNYIEKVKKELNENYIGVEQEENDTFNVVIPNESSVRARSLNSNDCSKLDNIKISFDGLNGDCPFDSIEAPSDDKLFSAGEKEILSLDATENSKMLTEAMTRARSVSPQDYDRIVARDYARTYSNSDGGYSTTNYNSSYKPLNPNDCANFVSQCIYAGGIATDSVWDFDPYTTCWVATGRNGYGLVDYMTGKGLFFRSTEKVKAFAGSIIYWQNVSHVGLIDKNDTKKMTFCAHTKNRNQCSFVNEPNVEFYIPAWDSYYNTWTPQ